MTSSSERGILKFIMKMAVNMVKLFYLTAIVTAAGGFAPRIESSSSSSTTASPADATLDMDVSPDFLGKENGTVMVHAGDTAALDCRVLRLNEKTVSWVRRRGDHIHILTVGFHTYHNDNRYTLSFEYPTNWKLQIRYAQKRDEGLYECQISTHPPKIKRIFLGVTVPNIEIRDPRGALVHDAYYRVDSTVGLQCIVMPAPPTRIVSWSKNGHPINTMPQMGIRVDSTLMGMGISSWLHIARATEPDSGNYTCHAGETIQHSVRVHVIDGESSAAMQHPTTNGVNQISRSPSPLLISSVTFLSVYLQMHERISLLLNKVKREVIQAIDRIIIVCL